MNGKFYTEGNVICNDGKNMNWYNCFYYMRIYGGKNICSMNVRLQF